MSVSPKNPEFHHTAYVVRDIAAASKKWELFGATVELAPTLVSADQVRIAFLSLPGGRIELVEPGSNSPIKSAAADTGHPDHLCFRCDNFDELVEGARGSSGIAPVSSGSSGRTW